MSYLLSGSLCVIIVIMGLGWGYVDYVQYLDATCFEFKKSGEYITAIDFAHTRNPNLSIVHSGDQVDPEKKTVEHTITIGLSKLKPETHFLVFTITAYLYYLHW